MGRRHLSRRTALVACLTAVSLSLTLCACTADQGSAALPSTLETPKLTAVDVNPHDRADLRQGGTLNVAIAQFSSQWSPVHTDGSESSTITVTKPLLPTFFRSDAAGTQTANPAYLQDAHAEVRDGRQVVTWTLNPKARWSDGTPITWRDIEANWRALNGTDPAYKASSSTGFELVTAVEKGKDEFQAVMTFERPFSEWQSMFNGAANAPLLPASRLATPELFNTAYLDAIPVTAGPFKVEKLDKAAQTVTLAADPAWWGDKPMLDRIVFHAMLPNTMAGAFGDGTVDFFNNGPDVAGYQLIKSTKGAAVRRAGGPDFRQFTLNSRSPALTDPAVRQAVFQAINRDVITRTDLAGLDWPAVTLNSHLLVANQNAYRDNSLGLSRYDPSDAVRKLDAAGWKLDGDVRKKDGKELSLRMVIPAGVTQAQNEANATVRMLRDVGIRVTVVPAKANDFFDKYVNRHDFDIAAYSLLGTPFPASGNRANFAQNGGTNQSQAGSPAVDSALDRASAATDAATAFEAINQADGELWKVAGILPLYQRPQLYGARADLANIGAQGLSDIVWENVGFTK
ncbi:ABC transporter family substrate-binding protein [Streptomyces sp. CB01881]|uniref:ABC transporter family substrate-binding protein n=1 Tax=Streptomyces sp. CB01881 TaxID=2078691 RepID=UPI000CDC3B69|nr:ABC transporter family substrate-binding protein [Streptomyces sp. CB01881]AUY49974.1 peptide ABC transporter substrate-binding protein [Streptomyces sp. CB01881]TYC73371.1 ABC transporter family substrate-binding protein [Streptomyces sp. CB01881]